MEISFEAAAEPPQVGIRDPIEQRHVRVRVSDPVTPETVETERFRFPVDVACRFESALLRFERLEAVFVRTTDGDLVESVQHGDEVHLDDGEYSIEICGPIKLYCRVSGPVSVDAGSDSLQIAFERPLEVLLGARSLHDRPAATITVPDDPAALMDALSVLSSALKTTSVERSYPTLRGHPPLIERGPNLEIPDGLEPPDTGVRLELPPEYRYCYPAAPLSFYLGAEIVPGERPLLAADGLEHGLATGRGFEDDVARILKTVLFCDCLVRTEGLYDVSLAERAAVEDVLPFDVAGMYGEPLTEQLQRYLEVPYERIREALPQWCLTAHVPARPDSAETLPFVVNDLGVVRLTHADASSTTVEAIADPRPSGAARRFVRSATTRSVETGTTYDVVEPVETEESIEHAWFGDGVPRDASKATLEAFRSRLDRDGHKSTIDILVVCNDERMLDEHETLEDVYGEREDLPFSVRSRFGVTTDQLATLLTEESCDFLHYIGHATPEGLRCTDGRLDVRTLEAVDVDVFFLNACQSYEQGLALSRRGAFGGVGTLGDVVNDRAVEIGRAMARLLNLGFPLRAAIELIRQHTYIGDQYLVVGDGSTAIAQTEGGSPLVCNVESTGEAYRLAADLYPTRIHRIGSMSTLTLDAVEEHSLTPGTIGPVDLSETELRQFLAWHSFPVHNEGQLHWNDFLGVVDLDLVD